MECIANLDDITNLTDADIMNIFEDISLDNKSENKKNKLDCPNCNTVEHIINDMTNGISICTNCGQVVDMLTDLGPDTRQFDDDKNETRQTTIPINKLLPQSSLGTTIRGKCRGRLKILHSWSAMPYKERSLNIVFKDIQNRCSVNNIMKCIEDDAKIMYKTISECKHLKGKNKGKCIIIRGANRKSLIGACVFFACRRKGMTRSPKEIADIFEIKYTEMTKGCKNFMRLMKIKKMGLSIGTSKPEDFISRFCKELKIREPYLQQTLKIAKNIRKLNIASVHTPLSSAASSILLMAELNGMTSINKKKLSTQFKVSEVTLTKTYKKLEQYKKALINDELTEKLVKIIKEQEKQETIPKFILDKCNIFNKKEDSDNYEYEIEDENYNNSDDFNDLDDLDDFDDLDDLDDFDDFDDFDDLYDDLENINKMDVLIEQLKKCSIKNINEVNDLINDIDFELSNELCYTDEIYFNIINN